MPPIFIFSIILFLFPSSWLLLLLYSNTFFPSLLYLLLISHLCKFTPQLYLSPICQYIHAIYTFLLFYHVALLQNSDFFILIHALAISFGGHLSLRFTHRQ